MDYYKILHFKKEPFSNSPDPEIFFQSRQHMGCLQKLELSIRMRRGLNVVLGDIGTGKTTLCRQIIREFNKDDRLEPHLILDPHFSSPEEFLTAVVELLGTGTPEKNASELQLKENIKQYLFKRGVDEDKVVVLIIDEGQKLPDYCLEILREFLNYETNEYKLLQIVIFAQKELEKKIEAHPNFADRINLYHTLGPLSFEETRSMVQYRLDETSEDEQSPSFFTFPAFWVIYRATQGYPRKIVNLCHLILVTLIIKSQTRAGMFLAHACALKVFPEQAKRWKRIWSGALAGILVVLLGLGFASGRLSIFDRPDKESTGLGPTAQIASQLPEIEGVSSARAPEHGRPRTTVAPSTAAIPIPEIKAVSEQLPAAPPAPAQPAAVIAQEPEPAVSPKQTVEELAAVRIPVPAEPVPMPEKISQTVTVTSREKPQPPEPEKAIAEPAAPIITAMETPSPPAAPESSPAPKLPASAFPETLGKIKVRNGETLGDMIRRLYGPFSFTNQNVRNVLAINSHLRNPNLINVGDVISFPKMAVELPREANEVLWVQSGARKELAEAYRFLRTNDRKDPAMLMLPAWDDQGGLEFILVLEKYFLDEDSARQAIAGLPEALAAEAKIIPGLDPERFFFTTKP